MVDHLMDTQAEQWFDGVYLLGRFNALRTGSWLLVHGAEGAILEMPPHDPGEPSTAEIATHEVKARGLSVKFLLCTHAHGDHFCPRTLAELLRFFPAATVVLHRGFEPYLEKTTPVRYFQNELELRLGGELLFLVWALALEQGTIIAEEEMVCPADFD
jgi:glyoxylase-like metal-dependent hydrolase (beta-lactamase superfamily II)